MEVFKINSKNEGQVFIIRPLLNAKNLKENILGYKFRFNALEYKWVFRHLCFALVNDELKIFHFSSDIHNYLTIDMFLMKSNKALKITVGLKEGFIYNQYEIIEDDKFVLDNTDEKRTHISTLLTQTELDLSVALNQEKLKLTDVEIKLPKGSDFISTTLGEIHKLDLMYEK